VRCPQDDERHQLEYPCRTHEDEQMHKLRQLLNKR
jgi:hypothetical protein